MDDWGRTYVCGNSDPFHLVMYDSRYLARNPYPAAAARRGQHRPGRQVHEAVPHQPRRAVAAAADAAAEPGDRAGLGRGGHAVRLLHRRHRRDRLSRRRVSGRVPAATCSSATSPTTSSIAPWPLPRRRARDGRECRGRPRVPRLARQLLPPRADGQRARRLPLGHRHVPRADRGGRLPAAADPQAHGRRQRRRSRPDLADRARGARADGSPRLGKATTAELVALLEHPNGWHRDTASRLLYQRQDRSAVAPLRQLAASSKTPLGRTHALYALAGLGAIEPDDRARRAERPGAARPRTRPATGGAVLPRRRYRFRTGWRRWSSDPDPLVRYQLAFSLGALPGTRPAAALAALAVRDGADPWMRMAILSSVSACTGEVFHAAGRQRRIPLLDARPCVPDRRWRRRPAPPDRPDDLAAVLEALDGPLAGDTDPGPRHRRWHLMSRMSAAARARLAGAARRQRSRAILADLLADARTTAVDEKQAGGRRGRRRPIVAVRRVRRRARACWPSCWPRASRRPCRRRPSRPWPGSTTPASPRILLRGWPG